MPVRRADQTGDDRFDGPSNGDVVTLIVAFKSGIELLFSILSTSFFALYASTPLPSLLAIQDDPCCP